MEIHFDTPKEFGSYVHGDSSAETMDLAFGYGPASRYAELHGSATPDSTERPLAYDILQAGATGHETFELPLEPRSPVDVTEVRQQLFDTSDEVRPTPTAMASLILRGLQPEDIAKAAGHARLATPEMHVTLAELDNTLPYIHRISDTLAETADCTLRLFAGRDAEGLYDDFSIAHPVATESHLMPASTDLWGQMPFIDRLHAPDLMEDYLAQYGLTREVACDPDSRIEIIDTGFEGTIGRAVNTASRLLFGSRADLMKTGRLAVRLVDADPRGCGTTILKLDPFDSLSKTFPKLGAWTLGRYGSSRRPEHILACSIQLHPRYTGTYSGLKRQPDGTVQAVPNTEHIQNNVDRYREPDWGGHINDSVVSPVAAAALQHRIVSAALQRSGRLPQGH